MEGQEKKVEIYKGLTGEVVFNVDVEDETAPDWNYMFTSKQDVIGGDLISMY